MGGEFEGVVRPPRLPVARAGQALIEFAVILPLFLFCVVAAVDAGLWAVQTSAEVSAVERAAMIASSAGTSPVSETAPDARAVTAAISARLHSALFGTAIESWCAPAPSGGCAPDTTQHCPSTPAQVQAADGPRVVVVCVSEADPPACITPAALNPEGCGDSPTITVRVIGFVASFVPPGFGPGAGAFELPTNISATTHTLRFAP